MTDTALKPEPLNLAAALSEYAVDADVARYLAQHHPDATPEERALHVLMLAILACAPREMRLKEPKGTRTQASLVISDASAFYDGPLDLRLVLYQSGQAEAAGGPFDCFSLFLTAKGKQVRMSRMMGGNEPAEFVGLRWAQANSLMAMACCPTLLLIVRRLPAALAELLKLQGQPAYRTGDVVRHLPSGEEWLVATADARHVSPCGWPYGLARLEEVELVQPATDEAHLRLLRELANMSVPDPRRSYAQERLAEMGHPRRTIEATIEARDAEADRDFYAPPPKDGTPPA